MKRSPPHPTQRRVGISGSRSIVGAASCVRGTQLCGAWGARRKASVPSRTLAVSGRLVTHNRVAQPRCSGIRSLPRSSGDLENHGHGASLRLHRALHYGARVSQSDPTGSPAPSNTRLVRTSRPLSSSHTW